MSKGTIIDIERLFCITEMDRVIFHVDLDAFFASVEQALNPELRGKPVVVGGEPGSRGVVAAASYEARAYGLRTGMPLAQAYRLCPFAVFLPGRFSHYQAASEGFMAILSRFTPDLEPMGMDEAYLDMTGFVFPTREGYGLPREAAMKMKALVRKELGITASVGIAPCKVVAKVASDADKPDGLVEVLPGQERAFLAPLPVGQLPFVGHKTEEVLRAWGIDTIGKLAALPVPFLRDLFGIRGEILHRWANGIDPSPVQRYEIPAKSVSRSTTLAKDTLSRPLLRSILHYLSERVGAELREMGRGARCVFLKLRYADFDSITRHRTLREPTDAHQTIFQEGLELMERALAEKKQLVRLVGIGATQLVDGGLQLSLLETRPEKEARLNRVLDRLREKYGFASLQIGRTFLLKEHYPLAQEGYLLKTPSLSR